MKQNPGWFGACRRAQRTWPCVLAALLAGPAAADDPRIDGAWVGSSVHGGTPLAVRLEVQGGASATGLTVRFGAPHGCGVAARRSEMFPDALVYDVSPPTGGAHCDALYPGTVTLLPGSEAGLTLVAGDGRQAPTYALRRPGSPPPAGTDDPRPLLGAWAGSVAGAEASRIGVRLDVGGVEPGDRQSTLRYGSPRQCTVALAYEGAIGPVHYFSIRESPGGYCDRLAGGYLWARPGDVRLDYGFQPGTAECRDGCTLDRTPRR